MYVGDIYICLSIYIDRQRLWAVFCRLNIKVILIVTARV